MPVPLSDALGMFDREGVAVPLRDALGVPLVDRVPVREPLSVGEVEREPVGDVLMLVVGLVLRLRVLVGLLVPLVDRVAVALSVPLEVGVPVEFGVPLELALRDGVGDALSDGDRLPLQSTVMFSVYWHVGASITPVIAAVPPQDSTTYEFRVTPVPHVPELPTRYSCWNQAYLQCEQSKKNIQIRHAGTKCICRLAVSHSNISARPSRG